MGKKTKAKDPNRLKFGQLVAWSCPGISNAMHVLVVSYLSIYCSTMLGLSTALVGTLLLASKIIDCFTDMVIGYIVDNTNTKIGRGRPYDLCMIGTWVCTILLYSCPPAWSKVMKCIWLLSVYVLMNSGFASLYAASNNPYMVRAFNNNDTYVKLGSYGGLFSMVGGLVVNVAFPILMGTLATSAKGWQTTILIFAIPGMLLGAIRFLFIKEKYNLDVKTEHIKIRDLIGMLKQNKYIFAVAFMMFVYQMVANMGVTTYYFTYVVGNVELLSLMSITSVIFIPVMFIFPPLLKKVSIDRVVYWGFVMCCVGCALNWFANTNFAMLMFAAVFTSLGVVPISMMSSLLIIDCADYNEWKGLPRMEATLGVVPGLTSNLGSAFGAFLLGICLEVAGFITTTEGEVVQQPDSVSLMLRLLISVIPLVFYIAAVFTIKNYKLGKMMPQIRKDLDARRASAESAEVN